MKVEGIINRKLNINRRKKTTEEKDIKILEGHNIYENIDGILVETRPYRKTIHIDDIITESGTTQPVLGVEEDLDAAIYDNMARYLGKVDYYCKFYNNVGFLLSEKAIVNTSNNIIVVEVPSND